MGIFSQVQLIWSQDNINELTKVDYDTIWKNKNNQFKHKENSQDLYKLIGKTIFNQCGTLFRLSLTWLRKLLNKLWDVPCIILYIGFIGGVQHSLPIISNYLPLRDGQYQQRSTIIISRCNDGAIKKIH